MINDVMKIKNKLSGIISAMDKEENGVLKKEAKEMVEKMKAWDEDMVQRKSKAYDDVENFPNKFTANYLFVINHSESDIPKINQPSRDRIAELDVQWNELKKRGDEILNVSIPAINNKLWQAGIGALWNGN